MAEEGDRERPLRELFARAVTAVTAASEPWPALTRLSGAEPPPPRPARAPSAADAAADDAAAAPQPADGAIAQLDAVADALRAVALFSRNEQLDEVSTASLKFLLVPYLRAVALHAWQGPPARRLHMLVRCDAELQTFFTTVDDYGLLPEPQRDRVLNDALELALTPAQRRDEKIARYKMEKAAEAKLTLLMEKLSHRSADDHDDTHVREASLLVLQSAVRRALDLFSTLRQEMTILRFAERQRAKGVDPSALAKQARSSAPPSVLQHMPPTFRIVNQRQRERDAVFQPSHSLPTYTIEQWGEIEAQRLAAAEMEKKDKEIVAKRRKQEEDSDGDEAVDRETMEARRWDDWKDDHNKGSGNTIR